jgi:uncharacterized phiE125 gp8 family phage protein
MWNRLERVSAPVTEVITTAEAKAHCRVDHTDDDDLISRLIRAARECIDGPHGIGIAMVAQQWTLSLDGMPPCIWIPMGPVLSIDSITYLDDGGSRQMLASDGYSWRKELFGARIKPPYNGTWPTVRCDYDSVQVTFTAGYPGTNDSPASLDEVPEALRQAMLMLIGHWYANRETTIIGEIPAELQFSFQNLTERFRVGRF